MVGLRRLYIALITCVLPLCVGAQTADGFIERQLLQLASRGGNVAEMLSCAQDAFAASPNDSLAMVIHELEKQSLAIESATKRLLERQSATAATPQPELQPQPEVAVPEVEQTQTPEPEVVPATEPKQEQSLTEEKPEEKPLVDEELKNLFNTTSRRYALIESEILELIGEYGGVYDQIIASLQGYEKATSMKTIEEHYKEYLAAVERSKALADKIADRSDMLLASKSNSLLMFADTLSLDSLRANYLAQMEQTENTMSEKLMGKCTDLDLAMYPHRLLGTFRMEAQLAQHFAPEATDSLATRAESFDTTFTLFTPYGTPKRSDAKFKGVSINKKAKEKAVSSLPEIKIPYEGELYSITVGNYASLPPSTKVFRGATPLLRERREDGRTYIYVGLYPTALSAQDDIALLRKEGFKQPTLVMWRDGIRRDDFVDRNAAATTPKAAMWRIEINEIATILPAEALDVVREKAPRKEISKFTNPDGTLLYTIGIFTKQNEAQTLASAIQSAAPTLAVKVTQIGKK